MLHLNTQMCISCPHDKGSKEGLDELLHKVNYTVTYAQK